MTHEAIPGETESRFEHILIMNGRAFEVGQYDVAYYLLVAAMHSASELEDGERLATVEARATEQGDWLDTHMPAHPLSAPFRALTTHALRRQALLRGEQSSQTPLDSEAGQP